MLEWEPEGKIRKGKHKRDECIKTEYGKPWTDRIGY
jgi:hypothetical protein